MKEIIGGYGRENSTVFCNGLALQRKQNLRIYLLVRACETLFLATYIRLGLDRPVDKGEDCKRI